jgi:hypothetical protein
MNTFNPIIYGLIYTNTHGKTDAMDINTQDKTAAKRAATKHGYNVLYARYWRSRQYVKVSVKRNGKWSDVR